MHVLCLYKRLKYPQSGFLLTKNIYVQAKCAFCGLAAKLSILTPLDFLWIIYTFNFLICDTGMYILYHCRIFIQSVLTALDSGYT